MSKIAIVGPGASGKDLFRKRTQDKGFKFGVSCTTRPPRTGEVHGSDYYYLTDEKFELDIANNRFVEWQEFNGWKYGMSKEEFEICDVMILNAEAVDLLDKSYRDRLFVIYFDIPEDIRLQRLIARNDFKYEPERRIAEDRKQFKNFTNFDLRITNPNF